jgi:hypothetical protein
MEQMDVIAVDVFERFIRWMRRRVDGDDDVDCK